MAWADRPLGEQVVVDYCAPRGIPLSVFCGRVVYAGDPQWTDDDRQAVYDWLAKQARTCSGCGQNLDESLQKDNAFAYKAAGLRCHACYAVHIEAARLIGGNPSPNAGYDRYRIMKREVPDGSVSDPGSNGSETQPVGP
jgi:hypothetical protein